jgi:hypothetical protein
MTRDGTAASVITRAGEPRSVGWPPSFRPSVFTRIDSGTGNLFGRRPTSRSGTSSTSRAVQLQRRVYRRHHCLTSGVRLKGRSRGTIAGCIAREICLRRRTAQSSASPEHRSARLRRAIGGLRRQSMDTTCAATGLSSRVQGSGASETSVT